ncbi:MAG: NHL repeat-containing protein [Thermoguttaceae bacterium]
MNAHLLLTLLALTVAGADQEAGPWQPVDQPDLARQLAEAPVLEPQSLAAPARGVTSWTFQLVPNPDGKTYDALQWYFKSYSGPTWLYACDLGTGEVRKQRFPDRRQIHMHGGLVAPDGKYYIVTPDWNAGMNLFVYDPAANLLEDRGIVVPGLVGETRRLVLAPDGLIYGTGNYRDPNKAGAYSYDWKSGKVVRDYGPIGPDHAPHGAWGYSIGVDDRFIYVASGKIPWYLVAVDIRSGQEELLAETKAGGDVSISPMSGGARVSVTEAPGAPSQQFWLYHGQMIPKTDNNPPWTPFDTPEDKFPPPPEVYRGQVDPVGTTACLWWRSAADAARQPKPVPAGARPEDLGWKRIELPDVETYPLEVHRLASLPDGRLFGTEQAYSGRFLFDPATEQASPLGNGGPSIYALAVSGQRLYWSGYPSGPVDQFDPACEWTLLKGGPPGQDPPDPASPESNPRRVVESLFDATRVKKMFSAAVGADELLYFGGAGIRDYAGGGLGWFDPRSGEHGGLWRPLSGYRVYWLTTAMDARYVVVSTKTALDELQGDIRPPSAKLFVWDTQQKKFIRELVPVTGATKSGPVLEVAPGRLLGTTEDPEVEGGGLLYGADVASGEILFRKKLPRSLVFPWTEGVTQWDYARGPDGNVYTYLGNVLVRIRPASAEVEVLGSLRRVGCFCFVGSDLYLAGDEPVRRLKDIAATPAPAAGSGPSQIKESSP